MTQAVTNRSPLQQLLDYPFRVFFVFTALWALISVPLWLLILIGPWQLPLALPSLYWHQHEMIFGLLQPAIAGFVLTAVCVWTQTDRIHGLPLAVLALLWLAGRTAMLIGGDWPFWLVGLINLAFLPAVMLDAGWRIWQARQSRQIIVLVVLGLMWCAQLGFLINPFGLWADAALVTAMALMMAIGGRITPAFSGNWLRMRGESAQRIVVKPWLEVLTLGSLLALVIALPLAPTWLIVGLALLAALTGSLRLWLWRGWLIRREPLLWILHLSLLWIPLALLLLALDAAGLVAPGAWKHAVGGGAMGGLILGVMSRVSLGHTGRPLTLPPGLVSAFSLIQLAALLRVLTALGLLAWLPGVLISAAFWLLAYSIFLLRYLPILSSPRPDQL